MISIFVQLLLIAMVHGQRPSFAGSLQHSGYKDKLKPESNMTIPDGLSERLEQDLLSNRTQRPPVFVNVVLPEQVFSPVLGEGFNNNSNSISNRIQTDPSQSQLNTNTTRLPYDALGNKDIVDRLNRLPFDQRPFWLINAQAIESHRNQSQSQLNNQTLNQQSIELLTDITDSNENSTLSLIDRNNEDSLDRFTEISISIDDNSTTPETQTTQSDLVSGENLFDIIDSTSTQEPIAKEESVTIIQPETITTQESIVSGENLYNIVENTNTQEPVITEESVTTLNPAIVEIKTFLPNSAGFPNYGILRL